jgi:ADP-heptose:LPS heptosyltransferase
VGLSWAPFADPKRLVSFEALTRLFSIPGVHWFALQRGEHVADADGSGIVNLEDADGTTADTAAAMMNLDLIISADTMTAHLAGALGRPVWTLLPERYDAIIWYPNREDTPWYPTMRLFWQRTDGDWSAVVSEVHNRLVTGGL